MPGNIRSRSWRLRLRELAPSAFAERRITDWNEIAVTFVTPRMTPPAAQREVAMVQVAMFDAVNSVEPASRYLPYLIQVPATSTPSNEAAAAAAAGAVLMGLIRKPRTS